MKYTCLIIILLIFISCRKNEISEKVPICNIAKSFPEDSQADSTVFKYNKDNKLSELISYRAKCGAKWLFTYPKTSQLLITYQPQCPDFIQDFYPVIIDFNSAGQAVEMKKIPSNGYTSSVSYSGNNIVSLILKNQGYSRETRFEYTENNVTKAYTLLAGNYTVLNYEGLKYDNMKTLITKEYMLFRLYANTFITDGMYDYLSQNNVLNYHRYLGLGPPVDIGERTIQYNSNQYPIKIIYKVTTSYGLTTKSTGNYQYTCK